MKNESESPPVSVLSRMNVLALLLCIENNYTLIKDLHMAP